VTRRPSAESALVWSLLLLLGAGIVYPLLQVLSVAVMVDGWPTAAPLLAFFARPLFREALVNTLVSGVLAVELGSLIAVPLALLTVQYSFPGRGLLTGEAVVALRARILPLATLVTPNLPEAAALSGLEVEGRDDMRRAADAILAAGARAVLVKGGHLQDGGENAAADLFVDGEVEEWLIEPRIATPHTHGTGCTLSAAIAAHLARGEGLLPAVRAGKAFVTEAIRHSMALGHGIGPVDQLWPVPREGLT
jgi:hydroxymethylpyrimidine/phosphomethylpyrimidine kinase